MDDEVNGLIKSLTLLKYDPPQLVNEFSEDLNFSQLRDIGNNEDLSIIPPSTSIQGFPSTPLIPGLTKELSGSHDAGYSKSELKRVLYTIFPPKVFEKDGRIWKSYISTKPATRLELLSMREHLSIRLHQQQAKEKGICPIRHELFSQIFDELIRQITLDNAERGLLLARIRDELRMTFAAYEELYHCASAYGIQKSIFTETGRDVVTERYGKKFQQRDDLQNKIQDINDQISETERKHEEITEIKKRKHVEDVQFLKRSNQQLKAQLDGILETKLSP